MQLLGPQNCQDKENNNYKELSWSHAHSSAHKYSYKRKQCNGFPWTSGSQFKANPVGDWGLKIGCIAKSSLLQNFFWFEVCSHHHHARVQPIE